MIYIIYNKSTKGYQAITKDAYTLTKPTLSDAIKDYYYKKDMRGYDLNYSSVGELIEEWDRYELEMMIKENELDKFYRETPEIFI